MLQSPDVSVKGLHNICMIVPFAIVIFQKLMYGSEEVGQQFAKDHKANYQVAQL